MAPAAAPDADDASSDRIVIKKYANRRLYNTASSAYVTLDNLSQMVREGVDFVVFDAKSGDDITRSVLTQIIVEEESKGQNLLPISFLRQLIAFYGHNMQWAVPAYLDHAMGAFMENQDNITKMMQGMTGGMFNLGDVGKQNMAVFEKTMSMFNPFGANAEARHRSGRADGLRAARFADADGSAADAAENHVAGFILRKGSIGLNFASAAG